MSTNVDDKIMTAWIAALSANTYIAANSIPVYSWEDVSHVRPQDCIVVQVLPAKNENSSGGIPNSPMFVSDVEITSSNLITKDKNKAKQKLYFQAICETVRGNSKSNMTTYAGGLNFSGWIEKDGDQGRDGSCFYKTLKIECHVET